MLTKLSLGVGLALTLVACVDEPEAVSETEQLLRNNGFLPNNLPVINGAGYAATHSTVGRIDLNNEFFQDIGTNGRRCVSCHLPTAGWSVTPEQMQAIFAITDGGEFDDGFGLGAAFRLNDGANSPRAAVGTLEERRKAYSMLLTKGLIRVGIPMPANADFTLEAVDDPYGYASAAELSLFRRPMPTTNLKFLSAVMWDGRETTGGTIHFDLSTQSSHATEGHAEGRPLTPAERASIVNFEMTLHTAQVHAHAAGSLDAHGAKGGAKPIVDQVFYIGINDNLGDFQTREPFTPNVFALFGSWANRTGSNGAEKARRAIARGEKLFNTMPIRITGVAGLNDNPYFGSPPVVNGSCTTCHNTPNSGNHSIVAPLDIGLSTKELRTPDMPLYKFKQKGTNKVVYTTDPGRALISGKFADMNKMKGPVLRGLASRAPYFHGGSAKTLVDAVEFYNDRFDIRMSAQDKSDLAAFLASL